MDGSNKIPAEVGRWLDELYALLFETKPKGGEHDMAMTTETLTCPNCGADMEQDDSTGIWECPECHYTENRG